MDHVKNQRSYRLSRSTTLANLLPLWLLSIAIIVEGFPPPPISIEVAFTSLILAIAISIVLLWKKRMTVELILYSFLPLLLLGIFDEISTAYKSPFIILCAFIMTVGIVSYQHNRTFQWRWLILLSVAVVTLLMTRHAAKSYWHMADDLGYVRCFPDAHDCPPLTGEETPWWTLFFGVWSW